MKFIYILILLFFSALFSCKTDANQVDESEQTNKKDSLEFVRKSEFEPINEELKNNPNNPTLYIKRARAYQKFKQSDLAVEDIDRAIKLDSLVPEYYLLKAELQKEIGNYADAKRTLDKCLMMDNQNIQARIELGWIAFIIQNYEQAIEYADAALRLNVYAAEAYYLKGMIFYEQNDSSKAISSFITATEQEADYYEAYIQLGLLHINQPNTLAKEYFKNALRIKPTSSEALYNYGYTCQIRGEYPEAIATYQKMVEIEPFREPYFNLGFIHQEYLGKYAEAIEYYTIAIQLSPLYYVAYYNRGLCYEKLGNQNLAEADFRKTLNIKSDYSYAGIALDRVLKNK
ncbi:MAG: tetratricopeptide repeat protein [Flavobacteriales bacterium]|nr:tetratricopeptide repeat protein [Flavobacteriales bacterium]